MWGIVKWLGPSGTFGLAAMVAVAGWYGAQKAQIWWQKDRRQYCEAQLLDYETKARAAQELIEHERNQLEARLALVNDEHEARIASMRRNSDVAIGRLSAAYEDSCQRLSEVAGAGTGNDGAAGDRGLPSGTGERLNRVAEHATENTLKLVWCQAYVRSLQ